MSLYRDTPGCISQGDFTLSSGEKSNFYINSKLVTLSGPKLKVIVRYLKDLIDKTFGDIDAMGGMAIGSMPISSAYAATYDINSFVVRKEAKGHGTKSVVEGPIYKDDRLIVIDDVTTSGKSIADVIELMNGFNIIGIVPIVDRQEGAKELLSKYNIPYHPLLLFEQCK